MKNKMHFWRVLRAAVVTSGALASIPLAGCLDRPVAPATPKTSNTVTDQVRVSSVDKIDLLFMVDNSASMADKQLVLSKAVPDLVDRLINPVCVVTAQDGSVTKLPKDQQPKSLGEPCPAGSAREFNAIKDIHIGVVSSSLGGHGSDYCSGPRVDGDPAKGIKPEDAANQDRSNNFTQNDRGRLLTRGPRGASAEIKFPKVPTYVGSNGQETGFFNWDPDQKAKPPGEQNPGEFKADGTVQTAGLKTYFRDVILGTDQIGCGYEASLESWYRFLIDPSPIEKITPTPSTPENPLPPPVIEGIDKTLLQQRAEFLRPDSLVAIVNLSDENDCSIIDGAMPAKVCDSPDFDEDGNPIGCLTDLKGWPPGYAEGNFERRKEDDNGFVTGEPFPVNHVVAQQKINSVTFSLSSGTPACAEDPYSPDCTTCYTGGEKCIDLSPASNPPVAPDQPNLRCWNQKQRFGVDFLYPLKRYVAGLTETQIYDRNGYLVQNPLYDDLPLKAGLVSRGKAEPRNNQLVFYASIVGVPWQDIARDPKDLKAGYKPAQATADEAGIDWDLVLGNPFAVSKAERSGPKDPLMIEQSAPRSGTHPITNEAIGETGWNSINGHEWKTDNADLQYACVFDLEPSTVRDCSVNPTSCDCATDASNPLCEKPTADGKGDGISSTTQYRAKAFPGTRFLQVARDFGPNAIVASICSPNLKDENSDDFGYRPAVAAIIDRLKTQLSDRCLPRSLKFNNDRTTPCLIIDAKFKKDLRPKGDPDALAQYEADLAKCNECEDTDTNSRKKIDKSIAGLLTGDVLDYECRCEVKQLAGTSLDQCQTQEGLTSVESGGGWCYVDPSKVADNEVDRKAAAEKLVEKCDQNNKHTIRFINTNTQNTTLFITCLGDAADNEIETVASGTSGNGGS